MLLGQQFHDIAPPVEYSLIPAWAVFVASFIVLALAGAAGWWFVQWRRRRPARVPTARERALVLLGQARTDIDQLSPYEFSIRISDILRQFVAEEYQLPVTRQTSVEFLAAARRSARFSDDDKALLDDFLNRCDLIKFARYEATREDSRLLLDEAAQFVKGGAREPVA